MTCFSTKTTPPPTLSLDIGAVVADVDMTIINDGHSELAGQNLDVLVEVLNRKIPLLLISGSPYDAVYLGVTSSGSLHRRVTLPLRRALQQKNAAGNLRFLRIFYASGRGTVTFDSAGNDIRSADRTDKDIDPKIRPLIFRAFLCGFYAVKKNIPETEPMTPAMEEIWNRDADEQAAALTRQFLQRELHMDVGALEKWAFGSELALVFHGTHASGPSIALWAQAILRRKNIPLSPDFFWAGGIDYAKASRIRKRDVIENALTTLKQEGTLIDAKSVLLFGDSNVDDFLSFNSEPHLSIFLGSKKDARNFPSAWLALDANGADTQQAHAFGFVLKNLLSGQWPVGPISLQRFA